MTTVDAECKPCGGTGLYQGFMEPKDTVVICHECKGTGCKKIAYTPFIRRKKLSATPGIRYVKRTRQTPSSISLQEFYGGRTPG